MDFSVSGLLAGLIFSSVGFVIFRYGKSTGSTRKIGLGIILMGYSYVTPTATMTWIVGLALTSTLFLFRDWLNEQ
jgi:hypothetical protein